MCGWFSISQRWKSVANAFGLKISGCTFWVSGQFWPDVSAANKFSSKDCKELQTLLFEILPTNSKIRTKLFFQNVLRSTWNMLKVNMSLQHRGQSPIRSFVSKHKKISLKFILGHFQQNCLSLQIFCCFADKLRCKTLWDYHLYVLQKWHFQSCLLFLYL